MKRQNTTKKTYEVDVRVYPNSDLNRTPIEDTWDIEATSAKEALYTAETSTEFSSLSDLVKVGAVRKKEEGK